MNEKKKNIEWSSKNQSANADISTQWTPWYSFEIPRNLVENTDTELTFMQYV